MFRSALLCVIACKLGFWQELISQTPQGSNFGASSLNWLELAQLAWSVCPQTADLSFCHTIEGADYFKLLWAQWNYTLTHLICRDKTDVKAIRLIFR